MRTILKNIILALLTLQARVILKKYQPKVVAITGSVGKTSTKDALYTVFASRFETWKSHKSFNSEFGVPLTIIGARSGWSNPVVWLKVLWRGLRLIIFKHAYPEWLILEVGADHPGDIKKICSWLTPDISVITRFSKIPVHIEFFASQKDVLKEKSNLVYALKPEGRLILNYDDEDVMSLKELSRARVRTFGLMEGADTTASHFRILTKQDAGEKDSIPVGITFKVGNNGSSVPIDLYDSLGVQHIYPVLAALSAGQAVGLNMVEMADALSSHILPPGRMRLIEGIRDSLIIDDSYNSSPIALQKALEALQSIDSNHKKIAVLGDMAELGQYSKKAHKDAGAHVASVADILITVGRQARSIAEGALQGGMSEKHIYQFGQNEARRAGEHLEHLIQEGDVMLVKGSQSVRMEKVVEEVMRYPEKTGELLVRQEKEWKERG